MSRVRVRAQGGAAVEGRAGSYMIASPGKKNISYSSTMITDGYNDYRKVMMSFADNFIVTLPRHALLVRLEKIW